MIDDDEKTGTFYQRLHSGELANESTTSTVALSLVLVLTIAAAQVVVVGRSGPLLAQENAGKLLAMVADRGLDQFLDPGRMEMLYLLEDNGQAKGFGVYQIEPGVESDGERIFLGKELLYLDGYLEFNQFTIANDLSHYYYQKRYRDDQTGALKVIQQEYQDGLLAGQVQVGPVSYPLGRSRMDEAGLIAPFMIDFFSSLALGENYSKGVLLIRPNIVASSREDWGFRMEQNWVQNSSLTNFPEEVRNYPGGQGCRVEVLGDGGKQLAQKMFFNDRHQLVWQMIPTHRGGLIYRAVDHQEILSYFPQALEVLDQWQREGVKNGDKEDHVYL